MVAAPVFTSCLSLSNCAGSNTPFNISVSAEHSVDAAGGDGDDVVGIGVDVSDVELDWVISVVVVMVVVGGGGDGVVVMGIVVGDGCGVVVGIG